MSCILQKSTMKENEMHFINTHTHTHTCIKFDQHGMLAAHVSALLDTKKSFYYNLYK